MQATRGARQRLGYTPTRLQGDTRSVKDAGGRVGEKWAENRLDGATLMQEESRARSCDTGCPTLLYLPGSDRAGSQHPH